MLKKTLAFGLLAASTIGFSMPAHAQNTVVGSQEINSQTVGVNGSHVFSTNGQDLTQVLIDSDYSTYGGYGGYGSTADPNLVAGDQAIDATTVGANGSNVFSVNEQEQANVLIDSDAGNYSSWYPEYPQPYYGAY
jgi:hypothetical protein